MSYRNNDWVTFLTRYGPSPNNEAAFDEFVGRAAKELGITPPSIDLPILHTVVERLSGPSPCSVILTGTAGDGKTFLCRKAYEHFGGLEWDKASIVEVCLPSGKTLRVIKDFTQLGDRDQFNILSQLNKAVFHSAETVFLIAANEGILIQKAFLRDQAEHHRQRYEVELRDLACLLEDLLNHRADRIQGRGDLYLLDLGLTHAGTVVDALLRSVTEHPGWHGCVGCLGTTVNPETRCPIFENRERLRSDLIRARLRKLIELNHYNGKHLTVRQLLLVIANALTGHADLSRSTRMLTCKDVPHFVAAKRFKAAYFQNIFAENLPPGRASDQKPFPYLCSLGVGEETNNRVDDLILYGDQHPQLKADYASLISGDAFYVDEQRFGTVRARYLEGADDTTEEFLREMVYHRRRLFFEMPSERVDDYMLDSLTIFRYGDVFNTEIVLPLSKQRPISESILSKLVLGLNRVFIGGLVEDTDTLFIAASGTYSQSRISRVLVTRLSRDEFQQPVELLAKYAMYADDKVIAGVALLVNLPKGEKVELELTLARFEFLMQVANGTLPTSFSAECYDDLLTFKSRVIKALDSARKERLSLLDVDPDGRVVTRSLQVTGGVVYGS